MLGTKPNNPLSWAGWQLQYKAASHRHGNGYYTHLKRVTTGLGSRDYGPLPCFYSEEPVGLQQVFANNVKDHHLLGEFFTNYRLPHTDRDGKPLKVGDEVTCDHGDSWVTGKRFLVLKLGVQSRAGEVEGHLLQEEGSITVVPISGIVKI